MGNEGYPEATLQTNDMAPTTRGRRVEFTISLERNHRRVQEDTD